VDWDVKAIRNAVRAQVLMKDIVTPVPQEEVRNVIKKCLENAALVNYTKVSEITKIEGKANIASLNHNHPKL